MRHRILKINSFKFARVNVSDVSASNSLYYSIRRALRVAIPLFAVITLMHPNAPKKRKREKEKKGEREREREKAVKVSAVRGEKSYRISDGFSKSFARLR